jgi:hypothetical protein
VETPPLLTIMDIDTTMLITTTKIRIIATKIRIMIIASIGIKSMPQTRSRPRTCKVPSSSSLSSSFRRSTPNKPEVNRNIKILE